MPYMARQVASEYENLGQNNAIPLSSASSIRARVMAAAHTPHTHVPLLHVVLNNGSGTTEHPRFEHIIPK